MKFGQFVCCQASSTAKKYLYGHNLDKKSFAISHFFLIKLDALLQSWYEGQEGQFSGKIANVEKIKKRYWNSTNFFYYKINYLKVIYFEVVSYQFLMQPRLSKKLLRQKSGTAKIEKMANFFVPDNQMTSFKEKQCPGESSLLSVGVPDFYQQQNILPARKVVFRIHHSFNFYS